MYLRMPIYYISKIVNLSLQTFKFRVGGTGGRGARWASAPQYFDQDNVSEIYKSKVINKYLQNKCKYS